MIKKERKKERKKENNAKLPDLSQVLHCKFLGSLYGKGAGYAGALWDKNYLSPTLTTMQGGNRQALILEICYVENY